VCQNGVEVFAAFVDDCCKTDDFGAGADDYQKFEATVVFEGYVAVVGLDVHSILLYNPDQVGDDIDYSTGSK